MHSSKLENLIKFPITGLDLSDIVINHELPHKCLEGTEEKLEIVINLNKTEEDS
jgi:hypothetical protein